MGKNVDSNYFKKKKIIERIINIYNKYRVLLKPHKNRCIKKSFKMKVNNFRKLFEAKFFDIAACKCAVGRCNCSKEKKFLEDQRTQRHLTVGDVTNNESGTELGDVATEGFVENCVTNENIVAVPYDVPNDDDVLMSSSDSLSTNSDSESESVRVQSTSRKTRSKDNIVRNKLSLAAAAITTAVLKDMGIVTMKNKNNVIDKNKTSKNSAENAKCTFVFISTN